VGKVCIGFGSGAVTLFCTYVTAAAPLNNPVNPPWFLIAVFIASCIAGIVCVVSGGIYLYQWIQWEKHPITIKIHDGESHREMKTDDFFSFDIAFTLNIPRAPIHIGRVLLLVGNLRLKSLDGAFDIIDKEYSHTAKFTHKVIQPFDNEAPYQLSVLASGKEWKSAQFFLNWRSVTVHL
jgi:hypothetical protein